MFWLRSSFRRATPLDLASPARTSGAGAPKASGSKERPGFHYNRNDPKIFLICQEIVRWAASARRKDRVSPRAWRGVRTYWFRASQAPGPARPMTRRGARSPPGAPSPRAPTRSQQPPDRASGRRLRRSRLIGGGRRAGSHESRHCMRETPLAATRDEQPQCRLPSGSLRTSGARCYERYAPGSTPKDRREGTGGSISSLGAREKSERRTSSHAGRFKAASERRRNAGGVEAGGGVVNACA
jgi:hypothetical protein